MELNDFILKFGDLLEDTNINDLKAETKFRELEEWSSLTALSLIGMVDEEYSVRIKGEDIRNSSTLEDLYNLIRSRK